MRRNKTGLTCSSPENIEPTIVFVDASQDDFRKVSATSSSLLGASVENSPVFSFHELQQLIAQLEKVSVRFVFYLRPFSLIVHVFSEYL